MAVLFNNTNTIVNVQATSYSGSMTVNSGKQNVVAFAIVGFDHQTGGAISSVTYGGQAMTAVAAAVIHGTSFAGIQVFQLINPPTGPNTLVVTGNANMTELYVNLVSFYNVDQVTPVRAAAQTATGAAANPSMAVTSNVLDLTLTALNGGATNVTATTQTSDGFTSVGTYNTGSDHATVAAATVTHTWTNGIANWAMVGFSIKAAALPGGGGGSAVTSTVALETLPNGSQYTNYKWNSPLSTVAKNFNSGAPNDQSLNRQSGNVSDRSIHDLLYPGHTTLC